MRHRPGDRGTKHIRVSGKGLYEALRKAFGEMGEAVAQHPEVISALLSALEDRLPGVRRAAAEALRRLGSQGASS